MNPRSRRRRPPDRPDSLFPPPLLRSRSRRPGAGATRCGAAEPAAGRLRPSFASRSSSRPAEAKPKGRKAVPEPGCGTAGGGRGCEDDERLLQGVSRGSSAAQLAFRHDCYLLLLLTVQGSSCFSLAPTSVSEHHSFPGLEFP